MNTGEDLARLVQEADAAAGRAALQRTKDALGLDALDAKAEGRLRDLEGRASFVAKLLKDTDPAPTSRDKILQRHPRLDVYFDAVDAKRDRLRDLVFGRQSRLVRARARFAELTPADVEPRWDRNENWITTGRGLFSPRIWNVYVELGNNCLPPTSEIDEAIAHVREAHRALVERFEAIAHAPAK